MKIIEKLNRKSKNIGAFRPPVLAFTGDSVTQGCFELYVKEGGRVETIFKPSEAYSQKVKEIFGMLYPSANLTVVNAGISGNTAKHGSERLAEDVLSVHPDLTVVCYGLNDCHQREAGLDVYRESLRKMFRDLKAVGSEVIFMTPNDCADRVDTGVTDPILQKAVQSSVDVVTEGWLERYLEAAKAVAAEEGVPVCDCYAHWKRLKAGGVDTVWLLANRANHPTEQMHCMFAYELVKTMFEEE